MKKALLASYLMINSNYSYYGSVFGINALKANLFYSSVLTAGADIFGDISVAPTLKYFRRKTVLRVTNLAIIFAAISFYLF